MSVAVDVLAMVALVLSLGVVTATWFRILALVLLAAAMVLNWRVALRSQGARSDGPAVVLGLVSAAAVGVLLYLFIWS